MTDLVEELKREFLDNIYVQYDLYKRQCEALNLEVLPFEEWRQTLDEFYNFLAKERKDKI